MNRVAIQLPLRCFGLEQTETNPLCPGCKHRTACAEMQGELAHRTPIDHAHFSFVPPRLHCLTDPDIHSLDPDAPRLEEVYAFCHEWVFGRKAPGKIGRNRTLVLERVRQSGVSIKMFLLANLLGWAQSHPDSPFHTKVFTGDFAVNQVKTFSAACHRQYGAFDVAALDQLMGTDVAKQDFEGLLLSSEMTAGSWIISYRLFRSGDVSQNLYREKELSLHPYWLAIEASYFRDVLSEHIARRDPNLPQATLKHRWETTHILGKLKREPTVAVTVFRARERIMPEAIRRVLTLRGYQANHFNTPTASVVTDPIRFWSQVATAIQHFECFSFVHNSPSLFDHHHSKEEKPQYV